MILYIIVKMQSNQDKQKFVKMLVDVDYFNKDITRTHVMEFLRKQTSFSPRESIRFVNDQYYSFLEVSGFMQIGNSLVEMFIGIPKNYPSSPPAFLINVNREVYTINSEETLLREKMISLEKNNSGQEFMRIHLPIVTTNWIPKNSPTLLKAYTALHGIINRPPILNQKNDEMRKKTMDIRKSVLAQSPRKKANINSKQINQMLAKLHQNMTETVFSKKSLEDASLMLDFHACQQKFLQQHASKLKESLRQQENQIRSDCQKLDQQKQVIEQTNNCDELLEMSQVQVDKLNILSQQQSLKEAEVALRAKIQKDYKAKFGDYKKVMKVLYDRMFDNQFQLLERKVLNDNR